MQVAGTVRRSRYVWAAAVALVAIMCIFLFADTGNLGLIRNAYGFRHGDKVGHFLLYGAAALALGLAAVRISTARAARRRALAAGGVLGFLASLEELSQLWLSDRSADLIDLAASIFGITVGTLVVLATRRSHQ